MNRNATELLPSGGDRAKRPQSRPLIMHARVVTSTGGGPDKTIVNSPRFLDNFGYDCQCVFYRPPNDLGFEVIRERAAEQSAPLIEIDDRSRIDIAAIRRTIRLCRKLKVSVWHAHDYKTNLIGLIARRFHPMKLVTTAHGWVNFDGQTPLYYRLDRRFWLPRYDKVICVSSDLLAECRASGVAIERSSLIENAIDTERFRRRRTTDEAKRLLGLPADRLLVGAVGRLSPEKGFDRLIRAIASLRSRTTNCQLVIIGDGEQRSPLQALIDRLELSSDVRLVGFRENTVDWYEAMDAFALSSVREGLPNVVLEAMAIETPVVATRVAGVPRVIEDGRSGLIVPIGDDTALTSALGRVLNDAGLRHRLARIGRTVIEERYSFSVRMERVAGLYDVLLAD